MNNQEVTMKKRPKMGFVMWLSIFIVMLVAVLYFIIGQSIIRQIVVTGSRHYTREEIRTMVGITEDTTVLDVFMHRNMSYDHLPYINKVEITYLSFNSIQIDVTEKEVISYIPYQGRYLALDNDGYVVGYENQKEMNLPSVTGLYFESASLGQQLDVTEAVLAAMLNLYHLGNKYDVQASEIDFIQGDVQMIHLYVKDVRIILGEGVELDRKMRDAGEVIRQLKQEVKGSLDLQIDSDHYIFKEDLASMMYFSYGERFIGVDPAYVVKKISIHRMKDQLLVKGLTFESVMEEESLPIVPMAVQVIEAVRGVSQEVDLTIDVIHFTEDNVESYELMVGEILLKVKGTEGLIEKLSGAKNIIAGIEPGKSGTIELIGAVEDYAFEPQKDE